MGYGRPRTVRIQRQGQNIGSAMTSTSALGFAVLLGREGRRLFFTAWWTAAAGMNAAPLNATNAGSAGRIAPRAPAAQDHEPCLPASPGPVYRWRVIQRQDLYHSR